MAALSQPVPADAVLTGRRHDVQCKAKCPADCGGRMAVPAHDVLFGASLGQWNGADAADAAGRIRLATQADRDGLDLFTVADHPYFGDKPGRGVPRLDDGAAVGAMADGWIPPGGSDWLSQLYRGSRPRAEPDPDAGLRRRPGSASTSRGRRPTPGLQLQTWRCNGTLAQQFWVAQ